MSRSSGDHIAMIELEEPKADLKDLKDCVDEDEDKTNIILYVIISCLVSENVKTVLTYRYSST